MTNAKAIGTPMSPLTSFDEDLSGKSVNEIIYRGMIGSLLYLTASWPDIIFSVYKYPRYQPASEESNLTAIKYIDIYLIGTVNYGLWYESSNNFDLKGFSYANFSGDKIDRKSTNKTCQLLGKALIFLHNKK